MTPVEPSECVVEIARYVIRRCRIDGNVPLLQVLKKVLGGPALVLNDNGIIRCCVRSALSSSIRALFSPGIRPSRLD